MSKQSAIKVDDFIIDITKEEIERARRSEEELMKLGMKLLNKNPKAVQQYVKSLLFPCGEIPKESKSGKTTLVRERIRINEIISKWDYCKDPNLEALKLRFGKILINNDKLALKKSLQKLNDGEVILFAYFYAFMKKLFED